jgi:hypothetical protein
MYVIRPMRRHEGGRSVAGMKTIVAVLTAVVVLAVASSAGAMPIDNYRSIPSEPPTTTTAAPSPSSGAETWVVIAVGALAFGAGAAVARLAPVHRLRSAS